MEMIVLSIILMIVFTIWACLKVASDYDDEIEKMNKEETRKLKQENNRLKEEYMLLTNASEEYEDELLQRISEAIEWINKHIAIFEERNITIYDWDSLSNPKELLEILRGEK